MSGIEWRTKRFAELCVDELYALLKLRQDVFVIEQNCIYPDIDSLDQDAMHVLGYDNHGLLAYSRILAPNVRFAEPAIGRVIVDEEARSQKLGQRLMEHSIASCSSHYPGQAIRISAQAHLEQFYNRLGFRRASEPYDEDGIPHIEMLRTADS